MATRVVQTVDWIVDDFGTVVGQQRSPGNETGGYEKLLTADKVMTPLDDGRTYHCTVALTATWDLSKGPLPRVTLIPPPSGNLSIAFANGASGNSGSTTTQTRTLVNNPIGVGVYPLLAIANQVGVSGS